MHIMMNLNFNNELAAQRRQELIAAADRHRLSRWSSFARTKQRGRPGSTGGRVLTLSAPTPVASPREHEHASACVA